MNVVKDYKNLKDLLGFSFDYGRQEPTNARIAGLLFAQPNNFTRDEILSGMDYFNNRSGRTIDFFCVGYQPDFFEPKFPVATIVNGQKWSFNSKIFNDFRQETEQQTKWKYSGSVELVLFNSYWNNEKSEVEIDFSDALSIDLLKAKSEKLITSVGELFEKIFSLADSISTTNPSKEMSLKLIGQTGKSSIVNVLFNLLPKAIQDDTKKIYLFGTSDYNI